MHAIDLPEGHDLTMVSRKQLTGLLFCFEIIVSVSEREMES